MITREQCLNWAEEAGLDTPFDNEIDVQAIEAFCHLVWNEALEEAAKTCESLPRKFRTEFCPPERHDCAAAIREMKVEK